MAINNTESAVTTTHPDYDKYRTQWQDMRCHLEGASAVKNAGTKYLPMLGSDTDPADVANYEKYKQRAMYLEATARTHQALVGSVIWKDPVLSGLTDTQTASLDDVTPDGWSFKTLTQKVIEEVVAVSRCGVLVDMPPADAPMGTAGQVPFFVLYPTESITNWRYERRDGKIKLTMIVLRETDYRQSTTDEFGTELVVRYRVLRLRDGVYTQQVYEQSAADKTTTFAVGEETRPVFRGNPLDYIPFVFCSTLGDVPTVPRPVLSGVLEVNISHYITSADLEHGRHFTALPQAWVAGFDAETELRIGSGVAWVSNNPTARAGYLEFSGAGLGSLERALAQKEQQMAVLGAKMLEGNRPGVIAAETARINQAGESATLAQIAQAVEGSLTVALIIWAEWAGQESADIAVELNKDFVDQRIDPAQLTALVNAYVTGGISYDTLFYNLQRGEIVPSETDKDTEHDLIKTQAPMGSLYGNGSGKGEGVGQ